LLNLQEDVGLKLISPEELLLIQQMWKAARDPDDGRGVARIVNRQKGIIMNADTLRRMVAKVEEYSESHRAHGLPDDLLNILKDDLEKQAAVARN
jgi:hypothetical protein